MEVKGTTTDKCLCQEINTWLLNIILVELFFFRTGLPPPTVSLRRRHLLMDQRLVLVTRPNVNLNAVVLV